MNSSNQEQFFPPTPQIQLFGSLMNADNKPFKLKFEKINNKLQEIMDENSDELNIPEGYVFFSGLCNIRSGLPSGDGIIIGNDYSLSGNFSNSLHDTEFCNLSLSSDIKATGKLENGSFIGVSKITGGDNIYEGSIRNGLLDGCGELKTVDSSYSGEYVSGLREGVGEITYKNYRYIGSFKNDLPNGHGRLLMDGPNGIVEKLVCDFVDGLPKGPGKVIDSENKEWYVEYQQGKQLIKIPIHEKVISDLRTKVNQLELEIETEKKKSSSAIDLTCSICYDRQANVVINSCGHLTLCSLCEQQAASVSQVKNVPSVELPTDMFPV